MATEVKKVVVQQPNGVIKVVMDRSRSAYFRSGRKAIQAGVSEVSVEFTTPTVDTNWNFGAMTIVNSADGVTERQFITAIPSTQPSQSGFTVKLSEETITGNNILHWSICENFSP